MIEPGQIIGYRVDGEPADERDHFYACKARGQMVDMRDLGQVFHHEKKRHRPLPENMITWPVKNKSKRGCRTRIQSE